MRYGPVYLATLDTHTLAEMPEEVPVRPAVDPKIVDGKAFDGLHPDEQVRARARRWFSACVESLNEVAGAKRDAEVNERIRQSTLKLFDKLFEESNIPKEDRLTEKELFPTDAVERAKIIEYIADPAKAPAGKKASYEAIQQTVELTGKTGKGILELLQRDLGAEGARDVNRVAERLERGGATKWDALLAAIKLLAIAGAITVGAFAFEAYMDSITGCFKTDIGSDKPPINLSYKICDRDTIKNICSCDNNTVATPTLHNSCAAAGTCWDKAEDEGNKLKQKHDYQYEAPNPVQALVDAADTLMQGLEALAKRLLGPIAKILIFVGIGIAVILAIVLAWRFLPVLFRRRHKEQPGTVLVAQVSPAATA